MTGDGRCHLKRLVEVVTSWKVKSLCLTPKTTLTRDSPVGLGTLECSTFSSTDLLDASGGGHVLPKRQKSHDGLKVFLFRFGVGPPTKSVPLEMKRTFGVTSRWRTPTKEAPGRPFINKRRG